jgi:polyhydroxyalkanoate synthesis regulator phasin
VSTKPEMVTVDAYRRVHALMNYYRKKCEKLEARKSGEPLPIRESLRPRQKVVTLKEWKEAAATIDDLRKAVLALQADKALLANEVMRWRAAFIHKNIDLNLLDYAPLVDAINRTNRCKNGTRIPNVNNPIMTARRVRDTDTLAAESQRLLPQVPKSHGDRRSGPQVPGSDQGTDRTCHAED